MVLGSSMPPPVRLEKWEPQNKISGLQDGAKCHWGDEAKQVMKDKKWDSFWIPVKIGKHQGPAYVYSDRRGTKTTYLVQKSYVFLLKKAVKIRIPI